MTAPPRPGIVPLRPLTLGEMLDGAFQAIRTNPRTMLGISALVLVGVNLIGLLPQLYLLVQLRDFAALGEEAPDDVAAALRPLLQGIGGLTVSLVIKLIAATVLTALLVVAVSEAVLGRRMAPRALWARVRPRVFAVLGLSLLSVLIPILVALVAGALVAGLAWGLYLSGAASSGTAAGVGVAAGILPVICLALYVSIRLTLAAPAMLLEGVGITDGLRRSWRLVRGSWWRVFGIVLVTSLITGIGTGILGLPFTQVGAAIGTGADATTTRLLLSAVLSGIGEIITGTVFTPFTAAVTSLLYIDRRMRAEGLDLELARASQMPPAG
jgi:hypothetical protein